MRILVAHNYYQQPGGEDQIFATEADLLESRGHQVLRYTLHNDAINSMGRVAMAQSTLWNDDSFRGLRNLMLHERPDIAHFHNTFPLISPAAYYAAREMGVPVVQSLHNYRLFCVNASLYRDGRVCEDCLGRAVPWPGVLHACYRGSRAASGVVAAMLAVHRARRTWSDLVDVYVAALTESAREKLIYGGLPAEKIVLKPNFVYPDPGPGRGQGGYALFVGRLAPEKGVDTLLAAWKCLGDRIPLIIVGGGPLEQNVAEAAQSSRHIKWLGQQPADRVLALMREAHVLVVPSIWYEGFPMVIVEAYAVGLPVIASDLGAMASLIAHGRTGLRFRPGDPQDLVAHVDWSFAQVEDIAKMRQAARAEYEAKYTPERNYQMLMEIYETAMARARKRSNDTSAAKQE